jgi:hypothetical protein
MFYLFRQIKKNCKFNNLNPKKREDCSYLAKFLPGGGGGGAECRLLARWLLQQPPTTHLSYSFSDEAKISPTSYKIRRDLRLPHEISPRIVTSSIDSGQTSKHRAKN